MPPCQCACVCMNKEVGVVCPKESLDHPTFYTFYTYTQNLCPSVFCACLSHAHCSLFHTRDELYCMSFEFLEPTALLPPSADWPSRGAGLLPCAGVMPPGRDWKGCAPFMLRHNTGKGCCFTVITGFYSWRDDLIYHFTMMFNIFRLETIS